MCRSGYSNSTALIIFTSAHLETILSQCYDNTQVTPQFELAEFYYCCIKKQKR